MNEQDDQKPENGEQELSEFAKARAQEKQEYDGSPILRGCGIAFGVVALIFLFIVGACFIQFSRW